MDINILSCDISNSNLKLWRIDSVINNSVSYPFFQLEILLLLLIQKRMCVLVMFSLKFSACASNCLSCSSNGAAKCDPSFCKTGYVYVTSSKNCAGKLILIVRCKKKRN